MARPRHEYPTPAELEVLRVLWERGPGTVRDVMQALDERGKAGRAYTSVMSLMNVMADKGLLARKPEGKAFVYTTKASRTKTLGGMVGDLLDRAFEGSANDLVVHLLEKTDARELAEIRKTIDAYRRESRGR
ncbi:MAG: transcriptional repressor, CopY family [Phycisphaerales bacterium]|nr:transcriptional repressor, CopY family [Phycisphaerales bacterium]